MTSSGERPAGADGASDTDWIDKILERVSEEVVPAATLPAPAAPVNKVPRPVVSDDIVPEWSAPQEPVAPPINQPAAAAPMHVAPVQPVPVQPVPTQPAQEQPLDVRRTPSAADGLAEIRWVDAPQVTPASTPIVPPQTQGLVPEAVGRSAYDDQLQNIGQSEPEGWDKLSWQDLDADRETNAGELQEQTSFGRLLREWGPVLFAAVAIALFTRLVLVQAYHIPSGSMLPTLENGDRVVVNRLSYQFGDIERGQVVVFQKPQGQDGENDLIKRVIGLPGEEIQFVDGKVYINGLRVDEPYIRSPDSTRPKLMIPGCAQLAPARDACTIPEGYVFVMGDNREGSSDSRVFGPVSQDRIVGRAFLRVWPLNNTGQL